MLDFLGSAAAAGAGFFGQHSANRMNAKEAEKARDFNREMASTKYQMMMRDMEAAGLNPILGLSSGGSSAAGSPTAQMQSETERSVSSALEYRRTRAEIENMEELNRKMKGENALNKVFEDLNRQRILLESASNASEIALRAAQISQSNTASNLNISNAKNVDTATREIMSRLPVKEFKADVQKDVLNYAKHYKDVPSAFGSAARWFAGMVSDKASQLRAYAQEQRRLHQQQQRSAK